MRIYLKALKLLLLVFPLCFFYIPLPLKEDFNRNLRIILVLSCYFLSLVDYISRRYLSPRLQSSKFLWLALLSLVTTSYVLSQIQFIWWTVLLILIPLAILWSVAARKSARLQAAGLFTLILTITSLFAVESSLRAIPDKYLLEEVRKIPAFSPINRGNILLRQNGFRGKRPCQLCSDRSFRIITMGGSSTFGVPMVNPQDTYSAKLQRILDQRRSDREYEVLNGGIAGYGLSQILETIEVELVKLKPDIITVCAWFNDSSSIPNWWGIPDKSDWQAYKMIRFLSWIENIPGFSVIHKSRLFGFMRFGLTTLRSSVLKTKNPKKSEKKRGAKRVLRMNPDEFKEGLERLIELGERYDFLPVLIFEPLHRTKPFSPGIRGYRYYELMLEISKKYDIPLINTLDPLSQKSTERNFYDFIHPNQFGHSLMAEIIYNGLFEKNLSARSSNFFKDRGVELSTANISAKRKHSITLDSPDLKDSFLKLQVRASQIKNNLVNLVMQNGESEFIPPTSLSNEWQTYNLPINRDPLSNPLVTLNLIGRLKAPRESNWRLGDSSIFSPVSIEVKSSGNSSYGDSYIRIRGENFMDYKRGYHVVVVDEESGEVTSQLNFDPVGRAIDIKESLENLTKELNGNGKGRFVIISVRDLPEMTSQRKKLSETLRYIGASGRIPSKAESFAMIAYIRNDERYALEKFDTKQVEFRIGDRALHYAELIEVKRD